MDPQAAIDIVRDLSHDAADRLAAADALADWFEGGGFIPDTLARFLQDHGANVWYLRHAAIVWAQGEVSFAEQELEIRHEREELDAQVRHDRWADETFC